MSAAGTSFIAAVTLHWTGGLASGSFYIPYKGVRKWSWETYWLLGGIFSWLVAPTVFAWLLVPNVWHIVFSAKPSVFWLTYLFGVLWGFGGLTFGLTMRYLGVGLGMAVALSYCAAVGTLVPPIFLDHQGGQLISTGWGLMTLVGVAICLLGIAVAGLAGVAKETELSAEVKKASVAEFSFFKGIVIATFSGIMSACFNFALDRGQPITDAANQAHFLATGHHSDLWAGLPTLIVILWGGLTTNFVWCVFLHLKNKSAHEYLASTAREDENRLVTAVDGPGYTQPAQAQRPNGDRVPLTRNYILCAMAGTRAKSYVEFPISSSASQTVPLWAVSGGSRRKYVFLAILLGLFHKNGCFGAAPEVGKQSLAFFASQASQLAGRGQRLLVPCGPALFRCTDLPPRTKML